MRPIERAIISVTDKSGIVDFALSLSSFDVEILSTGGTAGAMREGGVKVKDISEHTGFPEMLDGRVKTLHPKVHGGLLGMRDNPEHVRMMESHGILPIDMVVVNLYPFKETIAKPDVTPEQARGNIDIGGPCMIRASAKNLLRVASVTHPGDYDDILAELRETDGCTSLAMRYRLARKAFDHTASYDRAIADFLAKTPFEDVKPCYQT